MYSIIEKCSAWRRDWSARNRERYRAIKRDYYKRRPEERKQQAERSRRWFLANAEKSNASSNAWRLRNLPKAAARQQRRRTTLLNCMPPWADHAEIQKFYDLARRLTVETGIPHEVDHIVPVMGRLVTGLHIPINLQVIPAKKNRSKGARFDWESFRKDQTNGV